MSADVESAIDSLHQAGRLRGATLYAFGHTAATEQLRRRLDHHGMALAAILDNNVAKQGGSLGGVPIIAPEAIIGAVEPSMVLIASRFHDEMRAQLVDLGYPGEIEQVGARASPIRAVDADGLARGGRLLQRLRHAHPGRHLVICPFGALGDVYWALAYLPAFAAARRLAPTVVVVVGDGCRQVVRLFGHEEAVGLTQPEMDDLVAAVARSQAADATVAHHDRPHGDTAPVRVLDERFMAFIDLYRELVYGLSDQAQPSMPTCRPARADRALLLPGLPAGRTVLLAPYAKSVLPVAGSYWERTASDCASQGYAVATLVHGDEEPVPDTTPVTVEIARLRDAVELAGTFIALRSGLCDIVHGARARKIHVSPDAYYSTTPHKVADFFALPGWESVVVPVL